MKKTVLLLFMIGSSVWGQKTKNTVQQSQWVDSVYNAMTLEEKIGQLFMVAAYSNKDDKHIQSLEKLVQEQHIGGLIFFQGGPVRQAKIHNRLQSLSKLPMLVGIDGEWGLSMRLDSTYKFPYNMTLGAVQDMDLIEDLGKAMAKQTKRMGMQFNFGPVVDINTNPDNPIIGVRSFGETREMVTERAIAFTRGYQSNHIFATAKHFPGHGDTSTDSHYKLPLIDFDKNRLHKTELYPYRKLIDENIASIMVAHLNIPAYEPDTNVPSSLSYNIVTKLLREEMGYEGLIFTDALNMKAAANYLKPGEVELAAFKAGNDLLLFPEDVPTAVEMIKKAYNNQEISEKRLAYSVKKILAYKFEAGFTTSNFVNLDSLVQDLNAEEYDDLNFKLYKDAMTLLKNENKLIPLKHLEKQKIGYLKLGDDDGTYFLDMLRKYADVDEVNTSDLSNVGRYTVMVVGYHKVDNPWRNHNFSLEELNIIRKLNKETKVILVPFSKAYALLSLDKSNIDNISGLLQAYQNNAFAQSAAAQVIFGAIGAKGELPVTIEDKFEAGEGINTKPVHRLGFSTPANEGMNPSVLRQIDSIAQKAVVDQLTPGIQIVIARHGNIVYQKSFGNHTYNEDYPVKDTDLYDLASLTKILGALPLLMKKYDEGKINMNSKLGDLVPELKNSDKASITFEDLLTHQSGLVAWIPFYKKTLDESGKPKQELYSYVYSKQYPIQVSENLFLKANYNQQILRDIADSKLAKKKEYKYSDLGFIALKEWIENSYHQSMDVAVENAFYSKMGTTRLTYLPLRKYDISEIPPTEEDQYFRYTTVKGYVHDMTAAMQGGVSGHAGLFGTALDVAKMMQMYLNEGEYGGEHFFSKKTFKTFNDCVYCKDGNRRGVGFDKPQLKGNPGPTCNCTSSQSFGHTGFTGTMAWADPEQELVYVFLSNRTYPDSSKNRLSQENVRENIQTVIYNSIEAE
jgi:beta-glucosidase-like glycosyl hydrolase/CubicO group peptidase (beta-lactamase class C family)